MLPDCGWLQATKIELTGITDSEGGEDGMEFEMVTGGLPHQTKAWSVSNLTVIAVTLYWFLRVWNCSKILNTLMEHGCRRERQKEIQQHIYFTVPGIRPGHQSDCWSEFPTGHWWLHGSYSFPEYQNSSWQSTRVSWQTGVHYEEKWYPKFRQIHYKVWRRSFPAGTVSASDTSHGYLGLVRNYNW